MTNVLLISEDYIKTNSGLNNNIWGSYLAPAIVEAQDMKLQAILGTNLYQSILKQIDEDRLGINYQELIEEYIQRYLMYQTISEIIPLLSVKIANFGVVLSNDEHLVNINAEEKELLRNHYENKADFYGRRLQEYLLENYSKFPELKEGDCNRIKENLYSSSSTGLFLGGYRGRIL